MLKSKILTEAATTNRFFLSTHVAFYLTLTVLKAARVASALYLRTPGNPRTKRQFGSVVELRRFIICCCNQGNVYVSKFSENACLLVAGLES